MASHFVEICAEVNFDFKNFTPHRCSRLYRISFLRNALKKGYRVRVLTRQLNKSLFMNKVEYFHGDLLCDVDFKKLLVDVDVIVHAAAETQDINLMRRLNIDASLKLLDAAIDSGVQRWVQLSSVGAYGSIQNGVVDERRLDRPIGCYEKTKSEFDALLNETSQRSLLEVCIVRPSIVYGPGMRNQSIKQMVRAIRDIFSHLLVRGCVC